VGGGGVGLGCGGGFGGVGFVGGFGFGGGGGGGVGRRPRKQVRGEVKLGRRKIKPPHKKKRRGYFLKAGSRQIACNFGRKKGKGRSGGPS